MPRAPAWALLFQIDRRFTLRSFEGLLVALERSWGPRSAVRLGIQLRATHDDRDGTQGFEVPGRTRLVAQHLGADRASTGLNLQYVSRMAPERRLHLYWATGPRASYGRSDQEYASSNTEDARTMASTASMRVTQWSVGVGGALGVAWYPLPAFGLRAEYAAVAAFFSGTLTRSSRFRDSPLETMDSEDRGFRLGQSSTTFGLAVRF